MSSCWTRSILSLINTQENTHFRITAIALSVSPRSMTGHFPTGGYAITIICRKSNYWIFSLSFVMADDTGLLCDAYNTAELGDQDCTKSISWRSSVFRNG